MKRILIIMIVLLMSFIGYCQTNDKKAKEYYDNGCEKVTKKDFAGAITDFSEALKRDSGFIQAYENRGVAKFYLKDNRGAIADYTRALKINPNDYNTHGRRGWAEFYLQEYKDAITDFTKAIEGSRNNGQYYNIRGQAKYFLQDYAGAIADFSDVIKSWSGEKYQKSKAFYWRGQAKIVLGEKDEGCRDLRKAADMGYSEANEAIQKYCK
jgi:tetratricopeptide (TPR) repeat protein